jgi:hypothetical protein
MEGRSHQYRGTLDRGDEKWKLTGDFRRRSSLPAIPRRRAAALGRAGAWSDGGCVLRACCARGRARSGAWKRERYKAGELCGLGRVLKTCRYVSGPRIELWAALAFGAVVMM